MNDIVGVIIITIIAVAGVRSCDSDNSYDLERDGIKPVMMEIWCGTSCVEQGGN